MSLPMYDVAIVGGGPAGLTAAMWLGRYLRSVVLVDSGDPRNWQTRGVNGYLGLPNVTPAALRGAGRDEARRWGAELIDGCVSTVTQEGDERFRLELESGAVLRVAARAAGIRREGHLARHSGARARLRRNRVSLSRLRRTRDASGRRPSSWAWAAKR